MDQYVRQADVESVCDAVMKTFKIKTETTGFYAGVNKFVALISKALLLMLVAWAALFPETAQSGFGKITGFINQYFNGWYLWVMVFYLLLCVILGLWPKTGRVRLGNVDEKPEFSRISWFAMLFGAGIGIGMLTYATAEPVYHMASNPDIIIGDVEANSVSAIRSSMKWSFLHWGLSAWGCYAMIGLALALPTYRKGMPLTIRTALAPLFGRYLGGWFGHVIDIVAVIAAVTGVSVAIGLGVSQFASGLFSLTANPSLMNADGDPALWGMIFSLVIIVSVSTFSALSGVGKGIKWLSNLNLFLSFFLLGVLLIFGSASFVFKAFGLGLIDYIRELPSLVTNVYDSDAMPNGEALADWQASWTIFYWAWWIAFAPFVGVFFARISKGRSIREYVLATLIVPSLMCFTWFAIAGGTAIWLELSGQAAGAINDAGQSAKLFATIEVLFGSVGAKFMACIVTILLLTYLVTSADSAILVINTILGAGRIMPKIRYHIVFWGLALGVVIAVLLKTGGLDAIFAAMLIGALPFSVVMFLMGLSLIKSLFIDGSYR